MTLFQGAYFYRQISPSQRGEETKLGAEKRLRRVASAALWLIVCALSSSAAYAGQIVVPAGGNLQAAIDKARYGDEIVVEAGASFQGPIILRNKGPLPAGMTDDRAYITIRSSRLADLPPAGTRVSPQHALFDAESPFRIGRSRSASDRDERASLQNHRH